MLDRAEIRVKAGDGGDGIVSFRREKFVPFGGPDGGDGGKGGDVIIVADGGVSTLGRFRYRRYFKAQDGRRGSNKGKHGRNGIQLTLRVPLGTMVWRKGERDVLLADLTKEGQSVLVAKGGRGGYGNAHFATPILQTPRFAQKGEPGEEGRIILDLKLIADVGIIGYPNVGKSTLLAAVSAARPKIADWPFTTQEPVLGVVEVGKASFTLAEIPGLIPGAHLGRGLGHHFLCHSERTKLFIHLVDGTSASPYNDWRTVNEELTSYQPSLANKPQIVVVNKVDLAEVQARTPQLKQQLSPLGLPLFFISAATKQNVGEVVALIAKMLAELRASQGAEIAPLVVHHPKPADVVRVTKQGDTFLLFSSRLERLGALTDASSPGAWDYLRKQLTKSGATKVLLRAGVKAGDKIRIGDKEWEWI
jgi:GTP-binding protein